ncbi:MAG TPA: nucleoside kinase, partial [Clostridiales bacterium]|nr:nucleoside kinase [Clostridiales bacterium]
MIKVKYKGEIKEYPKDTMLLDISKEYQADFDNDIILGLVNNKLRELNKRLDRDCELEFVTTKDSDGRKTYNRGLIILMLRAIYNVLGKEASRGVSINYSVSNGLYCSLYKQSELTKEDVANIKAEMQDIVERDVIIEKKRIATGDAIELFHEYGMYDKKKLFRYRRSSRTNIYSLEKYEDYFYGYMPYSTGMLKYFDLLYYEGGIMLVLPSKQEPKKVDEYKPQAKLFNTLKESNKWTQSMGIDTVGALNDVIVKRSINELILIQEALQEARISEIAKQIKESTGKKFVMIAGPSSSGKTTFSHRLSVQLRTHGLIPHP